MTAPLPNDALLQSSRRKLFNTTVQVVIGGAIVFAIGVWLGRIGAA